MTSSSVRLVPDPIINPVVSRTEESRRLYGLQQKVNLVGQPKTTNGNFWDGLWHRHKLTHIRCTYMCVEEKEGMYKKKGMELVTIPRGSIFVDVSLFFLFFSKKVKGGSTCIFPCLFLLVTRRDQLNYRNLR